MENSQPDEHSYKMPEIIPDHNVFEEIVNRLGELPPEAASISFVTPLKETVKRSLANYGYIEYQNGEIVPYINTTDLLYGVKQNPGKLNS